MRLLRHFLPFFMFYYKIRLSPIKRKRLGTGRERGDLLRVPELKFNLNLSFSDVLPL